MPPTKLIGAEVTETGQNIATEHLLFTHTASGEQDVSVQIAFAALTNTAASITARCEHEFVRGGNTVLANMDIQTITKFTDTNTTTGMKRLGPFHLNDGEKVNVYATSTNASDTSVTYYARVLDETVVLSGETDLPDAPNATAITAIQSGMATDAAVEIVDTRILSALLALLLSPSQPSKTTINEPMGIVGVPLSFGLPIDLTLLDPLQTLVMVLKGGTSGFGSGTSATPATTAADIVYSSSGMNTVSINVDAADLDTLGDFSLIVMLADTNDTQAIVLTSITVVESTNENMLHDLLDAVDALPGLIPPPDVSDLATTAQLNAAVAPLATANDLSDLMDVAEDIYDDTQTLLGGYGDKTFTYTVTDSVGNAPIQGVYLQVTSDAEGTTVIAVGMTDANGQFVFHLPAGTVYIWRSKPGVTFTDPDTEEVT